MEYLVKQQMQVLDFEVWVHLGCSAEEQKNTQPVHYRLEVNFDNTVLGCQTDNLEDVVDYVRVTSILKMISTEKAYHLIEHLNYKCLVGVVEYLKSRNFKAEVKLSVKKIRVPIDSLKNGVVFSCEAKL